MIDGTYPRFSRQERDHRWARVRRLMADAGLDCLVTQANGSHYDYFAADTRYLCQCGMNQQAAACVFPLDGDVTAIMSGDIFREWMHAFQDWVSDLRGCRQGGVRMPIPAVIAQRLQELGLDRGRIGIAGLQPSQLSRAAPEGHFPHGALGMLQEALPGATFVDGTDLMLEARSVKSEEEVEFVRQATWLAEAGADALVEVAAPGVAMADVFAAMLSAMIRGGGELPTMILLGTERYAYRLFNLPLPVRLEAGDVIVDDIEAKYGGYQGRATQPVVVGSPRRELVRDVDTCVEVFDEVRGHIRPGISCGEILEFFAGRLKAKGYTHGVVSTHGLGLGDDVPLPLSGRQRPQPEHA